MSQGGGAYTFNNHRDALYKVLEAAVRGHAGCADDDERDNLVRNKGEGEKPLAYPTPFLWYEEIRPSDIDAYHAANNVHARRCTSGCSNRNRDDPPLSTSPPTSGNASGDVNRSRVVSKDAPAGEGGATVVGGGLLPAASRAVVVADRASEPAAAAAQPALGEKQERDSGSMGTSARTPDRNLGATVAKHPPYTKHRCRYQPEDKVGKHEEEEREEEGATTAAAISIDLSNADGRCSSKVRENKSSCCPLTMATAAATPPDPSQATQTMFLPGLPSQVLVTQQQQQGDAAGWEQHSEGDESSQQKEEDTPVSEYALSLPNHPCPPTEENASTGASVLASAGDKEEPFGSGFRIISGPGPDGNNSNSSNGPPPVVSGADNGAVAAAAAAREREQRARSRQNDAFTRALRDFVGQEQQPGRGGGGGGGGEEAGSAQSAVQKNVSGGGISSSSGGGGGGGGSGDRSKPPFNFLPTHEVLPSGWSGGQAGVVSFLEKHLSRARKRCPDGYAARALELACHVLRQPTVCVKAVECRGGSRAAAARQVDFFAGADTAVDDHHPEVVGVAGFVWEILRANDGDSSMKLAHQAASASQG